jgi:hypothetical protein
VENEDDAMVVYTFELLPEGIYAPTGVFRSHIKLDRPFEIDVEIPEVTWRPRSCEAPGQAPVSAFVSVRAPLSVLWPPWQS